MKTFFSFLRLTWAFASFSAITAGAEPAAGADSNSGGTIQVQIDDPVTRNPELDVRISLAFVSRVEAVFRDHGYVGAIVGVTGHDLPDPGCYLLKINLTDWRIDRSGKVRGSFTATLATEREELPLGVFTERSLRWDADAGRFVTSYGDADKFDAAMRLLYEAVARTSLIPGVPGD